MQLVGEADGVKELDGVGTDVDAGAELGELCRLFIDFNFEALLTQRDRRRQAAETRTDNGDTTRRSHLPRSRIETIGGNARPGHRQGSTGPLGCLRYRVTAPVNQSICRSSLATGKPYS